MMYRGDVKKKTPTQVFSCEVCKILKNAFVYRTPSLTASAFPVAASVFFFKKVIKWLCILQPCYNVLTSFPFYKFLTHRLMYKMSISFVYKFVVNCQVF